MATPNKFVKQPTEDYDITIESTTAKLPAGRTISSATVAAVEDGGTTDNTVLASTTVTVSGNDLTFHPQAGTDGKWYRFDVLITLDNGNILEDNVWMIVENFISAPAP